MSLYFKLIKLIKVIKNMLEKIIQMVYKRSINNQKV